MFALTDIIKYLTFISYFGCIVSSITGFIIVSNDFIGCIFINSLLVLCNIPLIIYIEFINSSNADLKLIHYSRAYVQIIMSILIMGISHVGVGFGIYGLFMFLSNLMLGLFDCNDNIVYTQVVNPNPIPNTIPNPT